MKTLFSFMFLGLGILSAEAQKQFTLKSPDGKLQSTITVGNELTYDIKCDGSMVLDDSPISMTLEDGTTWGVNSKLSGSSTKSVDNMVDAHFYRADQIRDNYNELTLRFRKNWNVEFRAYDDGIAYRFVSSSKKPSNVTSEGVNYNFPEDFTAHAPYVMRKGTVEQQFFNSFENTYTTATISRLDKERLILLPMVVEAENGVKVCITESDLESFPGLYLTNNNDGKNSLSGVHAAYPKTKEQGGHNMLQMVVKERENYIAKVDGPRTFPWRMAIVSREDKNLAESNMTYLLGSSSRVKDLSWIKPGKVAWEWWNDWNLSDVDFKTGVNNDTYKAYIDFASANKIEYVILDEGWAVNLKADLMQIVPEIDLKELVDYGAKKNVGIILWAGYWAFDRDMENVCRHYSEMGVKGFKVDFLDRDDQEMVDFVHRAAEMCAKYKMVLDLHGMYKPAGLNRTYPNILNFEGVFGMEQTKWGRDIDLISYDVMLPFIRQVAGPMDYTQGAMKNASKGNYYPCNSEPMSQGTRCHQLALYVVFESPFNMLCDSPSNYVREQESTDFISAIPTVWDETRVLAAEMGKYIVTARRSGDVWYIGGITNWDERDVTIDCSFLGDKNYQGDLFKDGVNAHRLGRDYKREQISVNKDSKLTVHLAPGGGFALKLK